MARSDSCEGCPAWSDKRDFLVSEAEATAAFLTPAAPLSLRALALSSSALIALTGKSSPPGPPEGPLPPVDVLKKRVLSGCSGSVLSPPSS